MLYLLSCLSFPKSNQPLGGQKQKNKERQMGVFRLLTMLQSKGSQDLKLELYPSYLTTTTS